MVPEAVALLSEIEVTNRFLQAVLPAVTIVLQSGLAVGAIAAVTLNALLPRDDEDTETAVPVHKPEIQDD
jgi:xanthine/uracil permease